MRHLRRWRARRCDGSLVLRHFRRIKHHKISVVVHPSENLTNLLKLPHLFGIKILEIKSHLKKLFNFLLYQKEQIPSFGKGLSLVGGF